MMTTPQIDVPPGTAEPVAALKPAGGESSLPTSRRSRSEQRFAWAMITPTLLSVGVFTALPILASFALSFFNYNAVTAPRWAGLSNYNELLHDSTARHALLVTLMLTAAIVVGQTVTGLSLAILVQRRARWLRPLYRAALFVPLLVSAASISVVMSYVFDDQFGVMNYYLNAIGLPSVSWLGSSAGSFVTIVLVVVWQQLGFTFIVFTAALAAVPSELLEAAAVDGASGWRRFRHITLPMISPSVLFVGTVGVINTLQLFDQPYVLTHGGPGTSTQTMVLTIYQQAFQDLRFGYASTLSVVLFAVVLLATYLQFRLSRRWVFYS